MCVCFTCRKWTYIIGGNMMTRIFKNCAAFRTTIPFCHFLDLVVVMTLVFSTSQRQWSSFPKKSGYPVSVSQAGHHRAQQIDRQSALQTEQKENTDRNPFTRTIHPHNHVGKSSFLKTLYYFLMIQRLVLSFRNLHLFH